MRGPPDCREWKFDYPFSTPHLAWASPWGGYKGRKAQLGEFSVDQEEPRSPGVLAMEMLWAWLLLAVWTLHVLRK